jgi:hypothetical protein
VTAKTREAVKADVQQVHALATQLDISPQTLPTITKIESLHGFEGEKGEISQGSSGHIPEGLKTEALRQVGENIGMVHRAELLQKDNVGSSFGDNIQNPVRIDLTIAASAALNVISHNASGGHTCLANVITRRVTTSACSSEKEINSRMNDFTLLHV